MWPVAISVLRIFFFFFHCLSFSSTDRAQMEMIIFCDAFSFVSVSESFLIFFNFRMICWLFSVWMLNVHHFYHILIIFIFVVERMRRSSFLLHYNEFESTHSCCYILNEWWIWTCRTWSSFLTSYPCFPSFYQND